MDLPWLSAHLVCHHEAMVALLPIKISLRVDNPNRFNISSIMNWIPLTAEAQLSEISTRSKEKPQVIFKHSTRCSISSMALSRLDRSEGSDAVDFYFLDLIKYRPISAQIAEQFHVEHESPQVILIKNGVCTYDESHMGISMDEILEQSSK